MLKITVLNNLDKKEMERLAKKYGKSAVQETAEAIYELSQSRCPVDTGYLKSSGYVRENEKGYEVGYNCDYVDYVDKMPQSSFNRTGHGGQAHFFSQSVKDVLEGSVLKSE